MAYYNPIIYYNQLIQPNQYPMDMITSHFLYEKIKKEDQESSLYITNKISETPQQHKSAINKQYKSPKRDNICCQCGQQYHWCSCHLQIRNLKNIF